MSLDHYIHSSCRGLRRRNLTLPNHQYPYYPSLMAEQSTLATPPQRPFLREE